MSETPNQDGMDDHALEKQLAKLCPASLVGNLSDELLSDCERIIQSGQNPVNTQVHWRRLVPLSLAAAVVMVSYFFFRFGDDLGSQVAENNPVEVQGIETNLTENARIVPVSAEGFLIRTSSGGIVKSENGFVEELNLEYQDAYHWRDPVTNTNIRFFAPRNERVLVPVTTD